MKNNYYKFKKESEAITWLTKKYDKFIKKLQKNNFENGTLGNAIFSYTGNMSSEYNKIIKINGGTIINIDKMIDQYYDDSQKDDEYEKSLSEDTKNNIKLIYNAFSQNVIEDNIMLFHYFNLNYYADYILKVQKGQNFKINNFISTTMTKKFTDLSNLIREKKYNSLLIIKVKRGTQCIPIGNNPESVLKENEIILKPGSCFVINKIKKRIFGRIKCVIECELI